MKGIAKFEKVSFDEFMVGINDVKPNLSKDEIQIMYDELKLPKRATKSSVILTLIPVGILIVSPGFSSNEYGA